MRSRKITRKTPREDVRKKKVPSVKEEKVVIVKKSAEVSKADRVALIAKEQLGVPYKYAGKTPLAFDCSGYTSYVFNQVDVKLTPASRLQAKQGEKVKIKDVQKGDLIFFGKNNKVTHVAIVYSIEGEKLEIIHATSSRGVMIQDLMTSNYWKPKILFARRVL